MYRFYLNDMLLPVTPAEVEFKVNSQNKTVTLMDDGEINIIKPSGLTDIRFEFMLPARWYPFCASDTIETPEYYLNRLEELKTGGEPVSFKIIRAGTVPELTLPDQEYMVTIEDYSIEQNNDNLHDFIVDIQLKQYRFWGGKTVTVNSDGTATVTTHRAVEARTIEGLYKFTYTMPTDGYNLYAVAYRLFGHEKQHEYAALLWEENKDNITAHYEGTGKLANPYIQLPAGFEVKIPQSIAGEIVRTG